MNLWYLFGGFVVFCIAAHHLILACEALPQVARNSIALVIFLPFTGQADPSVLGDYVRR